MGRLHPVLYLAAGLIISLMIGTAAFSLLGDLYVSWLIGVNIATFILYGDDKFRAKRGGNRVPEWILFMFPLIGGFLGGWLGMAVFRHKTKHLLFYIVMSFSTGLHLSALGYLYLGS